MKRGTIVLTKFPFTNLKSTKRRPAVVISKTESFKKNVIVAFISTVIPDDLPNTDLIFYKSDKNFNKSGLKKTSVIKLGKLATLNQSIFTGELGYVTEDTLREIDERLKLALDLK